MTMSDTPDRELAERLFRKTAELSADPPGVTRDAFGPGENAARELLADMARERGLAVRCDRASNLVLSLPGDDLTAPGLWLGSHLDSVPHGGNFDGLAGVAAGFLTLVRAARADPPWPGPVRVIALRCEESAWFGKPYLGSSLLLGVLDRKFLSLVHRGLGQDLAQCLADNGADPQAVQPGTPLMDMRSVAAYLEAHIEQAPVMVAAGLPVAVVTGVRGNIRHNLARCLGQAGHSGAVPRQLRKDAVFAFAELVCALDGLWEQELARGRDLVVTVGVAHTDPAVHALTRIPDEMTFSLDIRSLAQEDLEAFYALFREQCTAIETRRGVTFALDAAVRTPPAVMDRRLVDGLKAKCPGLGLAPRTTASGAGHDAAVFAGAGVPSAMIFIRNEGGSHNPAETMDLGDFMAAAELMTAFAADFDPKRFRRR